MADWHLIDLENALGRSHWVVLERLPGDDYWFSGFWVIARPDGSQRLTLAFHGLDDTETLPMEKSYACEAVSIDGASLYFAKRSSWKKELTGFISVLEKLQESSDKAMT